MAVGLGLMSLTQFQKLSPSQTPHENNTRSSNFGLWMWNKKQQLPEDEDDSWEVRAFEEDTAGNLMGCTWPPRSYTCTFCRREFRSAQALGGHMNVHRRDRARLHEKPTNTPASRSISDKSTPPTILIPTQDLLTNGLCLLYPIPNPNGNIIIPRASINGNIVSSSPLLSVVSSLTADKPTDFPFAAAVSSLSHSSNVEEPPGSYGNDHNNQYCDNGMCLTKDSSAIEELDLELRLGRHEAPSSSSQEGRLM